MMHYPFTINRNYSNDTVIIIIIIIIIRIRIITIIIIIISTNDFIVIIKWLPHWIK